MPTPEPIKPFPIEMMWGAPPCRPFAIGDKVMADDGQRLIVSDRAPRAKMQPLNIKLLRLSGALRHGR